MMSEWKFLPENPYGKPFMAVHDVEAPYDGKPVMVRNHVFENKTHRLRKGVKAHFVPDYRYKFGGYWRMEDAIWPAGGPTQWKSL